jgi:hypothetical protein
MSTDVLLVVEVAETSLEYDREEKLPRYAQVLILEGWLIDVERETVTPYTQPDGMGYCGKQLLGRSQIIVSHTVSNLRLSVAGIFGCGAGQASVYTVSEMDSPLPSAALFRKFVAQFEICVCALNVEKEFLQDVFYQYLRRQMLT